MLQGEVLSPVTLKEKSGFEKKPSGERKHAAEEQHSLEYFSFVV